MQLKISEQVKQVMTDRHIYEEDIKAVIEAAEVSGEKLYQPGTNKFLAKRKLGNATFYAVYSPTGDDGFEVHSAYSHRSELEGV